MEDNQSCIQFAKNEMLKERSKHIGVKYHFVKDLVRKKQLLVEYVATQEQIAD